MIGWVEGLQGAAAALSIGGSLFGRKKSNGLSREQRKLIGEQTEIARDLRDIGNDQYALSQEYSDPIFDQIFDEILSGPDYETALGNASADVNQAFGNQMEATNRNKFRYGINPASGNVQNDIYRNGLNKSLATVNARNKSRREEDDKHWARLLTGGNTVQSFVSNAVNAGNAAMGGMNSSANQYGGMAKQYADDASSGMQSAGYTLGNLAREWDSAPSNGWGNVSASDFYDSNMNGLTFDQVDW